MSLYYVTGIAGAGKSETYKELKKRGVEVYGTDEDQLAGFYNNDSGNRVGNPADSDGETDPDFRNHHTWKLPRTVIEGIKEESTGKNVFLCGVAANEEEFLDLFDKLFALILDDQTVLRRIASRNNNSFGKEKDELEQIKEWQASTPAYYTKHNFVQIDAAQPVEQVVDELLASIKSE